jgi:hypothetical protein
MRTGRRCPILHDRASKKKNDRIDAGNLADCLR